MKYQLPVLALLALSFTACDNDGTTGTTTTDSATVASTTDMNAGTTMAATGAAFTPRQGVQYMDLRTRKLISVRVDTVHHYIVNAETNEPVEWIMEPGSTDTFYGRNMQRANGYINYGSGSDWTWDERRASNSAGSDMSSNDMAGVEKIKTNGEETKIKMEDGSKMKTNGEETKVKMSDGSKIKSNGNETKIKNGD